jgi:hypothetical protein
MFLNESHVSFQNPPSRKDAVWRYMDIAKFVALLEDQSLYFARADLMLDKWEGGLDYRTMQDAGIREAEKYERQTVTNYISSWHVSEHESAAMWEIYQREGRGIAIRTTWDRLTTSLRGPWGIRGGKVNYVDYTGFRIPLDNQYSRFMYKRLSFEFEREGRLILWAEGPDGPAWVSEDGEYSQDSQLQGDKLLPGYNVPVDLDNLVQSVYVAPGSPRWFVDLVTRIPARYGRTWPVVTTDLGAPRLK